MYPIIFEPRPWVNWQRSWPQKNRLCKHMNDIAPNLKRHEMSLHHRFVRRHCCSQEVLLQNQNLHSSQVCIEPRRANSTVHYYIDACYLATIYIYSFFEFQFLQSLHRYNCHLYSTWELFIYFKVTVSSMLQTSCKHLLITATLNKL